MPPELNDSEEDVISLDDEGNEAGAAAEDRGDVVDPGLSPDVLQAVVDGAGAVADETGGDDAGQAEARAGNQGIPRARFNEVNEQRKEFQRQLEEANRELERLRSGAPAQAAARAPEVEDFDVDAKEKAFIDALLDGDREVAAGIRREINVHLQRSSVQEYRQIQSLEQTRNALADVTEQTLQAYPWLETPAGAEALEMICALRDRKIAGGLAPSRALAEAVNRLAPMFSPDDDAPPVALPDGKAATDTRASKSLARGAADAMLQPPAVQAGIGNRTTGGRIDVNNLSEEQFDNLTPAEKKKLRGD